MASAAARRSPRTRVRSLASMATSVPVPMAMPRSAWARAAASFTPSPTMATTRPSACSRAHDVDLARRAAPRRRPRRCRPRRPRPAAARSLSPVSSTGRSPRARSRRPPSAEVGFTVSATTSTPRARAVPADDRPAVRPAASAASAAARRSSGSAAPPARNARGRRRHGVAVDDALHAEAAGRRRRPRPAASATPRRACAGGDGPRRSGARWRPRATPARRSTSSSRSRPPTDVDQRHAAGGDGAGLVEHDGVDPCGSTPAPRGP